MASRVRRVLKRLVLGPGTLSQQCAIGSRDPQEEVVVQLHGLGAPRDVTDCNVMVAAKPFTIGIVLPPRADASLIRRARLSVQFRERAGKNKLLGEIGLRLRDIMSVRSEHLGLFEVRYCHNYCLPRVRLWARRLRAAYDQSIPWKQPQKVRFRMTALGSQSLSVFYICPRPVVLVSVADGSMANVFPMDLIGPIGAGHFSLALNCTSTGVPLMERSRRIALSSVPLDRAELAFALGQNHKQPGVNMNELPFSTTPSPQLGIPVPQFSLRVREMQIESVRSVGSHKLFLAATLNDEWWADGLQLFFVHGFYQAWKQRNQVEISNLCSARARAGG
jgi:flavin reductase (DIM6/NTAB) family NADH-FMN oxidoreductase RutF